VKNGWQAEQISTLIWGFVERVSNVFPQAHVTIDFTYSGCMFFFKRCTPSPKSYSSRLLYGQATTLNHTTTGQSSAN